MPPALFNHAQTIYEAMKETATEIDGALVWEGHLTKLFAELGLPGPAYTHVLRSLKEMACLEQLQRGGGSGKSKWLLRQEPTAEIFEAKGTESKRKASMAEQIDIQRINDLNTRIAAQATHLSQLETRVKMLEDAANA